MCEATALPARPRGSKPTFRNGKQQKEKRLPHSCNPETETSLAGMNYFEAEDNLLQIVKSRKKTCIFKENSSRFYFTVSWYGEDYCSKNGCIDNYINLIDFA